MAKQARIIDMPKQRQVDGVRQHQVVQLAVDLQKLREHQPWRVQSQVDIGAWPKVAFGARAINDSTLYARVLIQHPAQLAWRAG